MSLINRLIAEAKSSPPPRELTIRPNDVRKVALHCQSVTSHWADEYPLEMLENQLRRGDIRMLGVPIRVLGRA